MARAKNRTISAKVSPETVLLIDQAAVTRGVARQAIVEEGAIRFANQLVAEASARTAEARKLMRRAKARLGGLARQEKARRKGLAKSSRRRHT